MNTKLKVNLGGSLKKKIWTTNVIVFSAVMLILGMSLYFYLRDYNLKINEEYEQRLLAEISNGVEREIEQIDMLTYGILTNEGLKRDIMHYYMDAPQKPSRYDIIEFLVQILFSSNKLASVEIIDIEDNIYSTMDSFNAYSGEQIEEIKERAYATKGELIFAQHPNEVNQMQAIRLIKDNTLHNIGILIFSIRKAPLQDVVLKGKNTSGEIIIADVENRVVLSSDSNLLDLMLSDDIESQLSEKYGGSVLLTSYKSSFNDWTYYNVIVKSKLLQELKPMFLVIISLFSVVIVVLSVLSLVQSKSISRPIEQITENIKKTEIQGWEPFTVESDSDEIYYLNQAFNSLMHSVETLQIKVYKEEILIARQKFDQLQAQINPHFLYNTLDFVNWTARKKGIDDIGEIVKSLSDIFRYSLGGDGMVDVATEIEYTKKYLLIQQYRYKSKLNINFDIDERILGQEMIKLTLQPLVENSFKHGFSNTVDTYDLTIRGYIENDNMVFEIKDNGVGIEEDTLKSINENISTISSKHVGVSNVNQRIQLTYGEAYGIKLYQNYPQGVIVKITLPLI